MYTLICMQDNQRPKSRRMTPHHTSSKRLQPAPSIEPLKSQSAEELESREQSVHPLASKNRQHTHVGMLKQSAKGLNGEIVQIYVLQTTQCKTYIICIDYEKRSHTTHETSTYIYFCHHKSQNLLEKNVGDHHTLYNSTERRMQPATGTRQKHISLK